MLRGKTVVIGVTGSIAAFKAAQLVSDLVKQQADVHVIMTKNAVQFISPVTFETLTGHKCMTDTFDRNFEFKVAHISIAQKADLIMIAPASANIIGKLASGIADDMLTTVVMAATCPVVIAPAMNKNMYLNKIVQDNMKKLRAYGYFFAEPETGRLACDDVGIGKLAAVDTLLKHIEYHIDGRKDLHGKRVLVTAGPTREAMDPVRFITNHSSGKMGYAIAAAAARRGAIVELVSGPVNLTTPIGVKGTAVTSAEEMYHAVIDRFDQCDIAILAAAVADYTPLHYAEQKVKKAEGDLLLPLKRTEDILKAISALKREDQFVCGFSMETDNLLDNSRKKLENKHCDMIVANSIAEEGTGFGTDTNKVALITADSIKELELMSKQQVADQILSEIISRFC